MGCQEAYNRRLGSAQLLPVNIRTYDCRLVSDSPCRQDSQVRNYFEEMMMFCLLSLLMLLSCTPGIDREALVARNSPAISGYDELNSLSVGNGEFAVTVDFTGLQTYFDAYYRGAVRFFNAVSKAEQSRSFSSDFKMIFGDS